MDIRHSIALKSGNVSVATARCELPLFGCWSRLDITAFCFGESADQAPFTSISFGIKSLANKDLYSLDWMNALSDGTLLFKTGSNGHAHDVEQHFSIPIIIGQLFSSSQLRSGGNSAGRALASSILNGVEGIVESIRQSIRKQAIGQFRDICLRVLHDRYWNITQQTVQAFLKQINWELLLWKSSCDGETLETLNRSLTGELVRCFSISYNDDTGIEAIGDVVPGGFRNRFGGCIADIRAADLLRNVCGNELGDEFDNRGHITVNQFGYRFVIIPNQMIRCIDPHGRKAYLCIHTEGHLVNPIDELVIAYLHLTHKFDEYMKMANVHYPEKGFSINIRP